MKSRSNKHVTRQYLLRLRTFAKNYWKPTRPDVFADGLGEVVSGAEITAVKSDVCYRTRDLHVDHAVLQELFDRVSGFLGNPVPKYKIPAWAVRHRKVAFELGNLLAKLSKSDVVALADEFQNRLLHVEFHVVNPSGAVVNFDLR